MKRTLIRTKLKKTDMSQQQTGQVATRWYQSPEQILFEKDDGLEANVWAAGCIFAELLMMMKENAPTFVDRKPLFPGKSCFSLSQAQKTSYTRDDLLSNIFNVLGTPSQEDLISLNDEASLEYLLSSFVFKERCDLQQMYKGAPTEAIDFLDKILRFNPDNRLSLSDATTHPLFDPVRSNIE